LQAQISVTFNILPTKSRFNTEFESFIMKYCTGCRCTSNYSHIYCSVIWYNAWLR